MLRVCVCVLHPDSCLGMHAEFIIQQHQPLDKGLPSFRYLLSAPRMKAPATWRMEDHVTKTQQIAADMGMGWVWDQGTSFHGDQELHDLGFDWYTGVLESLWWLLFCLANHKGCGCSEGLGNTDRKAWQPRWIVPCYLEKPPSPRGNGDASISRVSATRA